ncbi:MAG: hypothetical protein Kow00120_18460 [Anaerolineae bacterium]
MQERRAEDHPGDDKTHDLGDAGAVRQTAHDKRDEKRHPNDGEDIYRQSIKRSAVVHVSLQKQIPVA